MARFVCLAPLPVSTMVLGKVLRKVVGMVVPAGLLTALLTVGLLLPGAAIAAPGLCVGPVCADGFSRSAKHAFQLRMRLADQRGHHERITVDCRDGRISPVVGPVERGYGAAVARRVCRLVGETPA